MGRTDSNYTLYLDDNSMTANEECKRFNEFNHMQYSNQN